MFIVVGGHTRNIGKTSVMAGLIEALRGFHWTAVKITQFGHGVCATAGEACDCTLDYEHPYALTEERRADSGTDSSRYLAAGAARSYWLRTAVGQLGNALPAFRRLRDGAENLIVESNSILQFVKPDLYLVVLDSRREDFKASSRLYLDRADALVRVNGGGSDAWSGIAPRLIANKPEFAIAPPPYVTAELAEFVGSWIRL